MPVRRFLKFSSSAVRKFRSSGYPRHQIKFMYYSKIVQSKSTWRDLHLEICACKFSAKFWRCSRSLEANFWRRALQEGRGSVRKFSAACLARCSRSRGSLQILAQRGGATARFVLFSHKPRPLLRCFATSSCLAFRACSCRRSAGQSLHESCGTTSSKYPRSSNGAAPSGSCRSASSNLHVCSLLH